MDAPSEEQRPMTVECRIIHREHWRRTAVGYIELIGTLATNPFGTLDQSIRSPLFSRVRVATGKAYLDDEILALSYLSDDVL